MADIENDRRSSCFVFDDISKGDEHEPRYELMLIFEHEPSSPLPDGIEAAHVRKEISKLEKPGFCLKMACCCCTHGIFRCCCGGQQDDEEEEQEHKDENGGEGNGSQKHSSTGCGSFCNNSKKKKAKEEEEEEEEEEFEPEVPLFLRICPDDFIKMCQEDCGWIADTWNWITTCGARAQRQKKKIAATNELYVSLYQTLRNRGLHVQAKLSSDCDQKFLLIGASEALLEATADDIELPVQLKRQEGGGMVAYDRSKRSLFKKPNYEKWLKAPPSVFTPAHRQELLMHLVTGNVAEGGCGIRLQKLTKSKYMQRYLFLHDPQQRDYLRSNWATASMGKRLQSSAIRLYFGERIALYFSFLSFYTKALLFPAAAGLAIFLYSFLSWKTFKTIEEDEVYDNLFIPFYTVFLTIWAALFIEYWKQKSSTLVYKWGMLEYDKMEGVRENFQYELRTVDFLEQKFQLPLRIDRDQMVEKYYPSWRRMLSYIKSWPTIITMIGIVLFTIYVIQRVRIGVAEGTVTIAPDAYQATIVNQMNTVAIIVFGAIYKYVAVLLTNYENHRTETDHENALVVKTFLFQMINSYTPSFIILFWPNPSYSSAQRMKDLFNQLLVLYINQAIVGNFKEVAIPFLVRRIKTTREKYQSLMNGSGFIHKLSFEEKQASMSVYLSSSDDYEELAMQFGFVTLFAAAFPLGAVFALVSNVIEFRVDSIKLCDSFARPQPKGASSIGAWLRVLEAIQIISIITNSAMLCFSSNSLASWVTAGSSQPGVDLPSLLAFVGFEHFLIIVLMFIKFGIKDMPSRIQKKLAVEEFKRDISYENSLRKTEFDVEDSDEEEAIAAAEREHDPALSPRALRFSRRSSSKRALSSPRASSSHVLSEKTGSVGHEAQKAPPPPSISPISHAPLPPLPLEKGNSPQKAMRTKFAGPSIIIDSNENLVSSPSSAASSSSLPALPPGASASSPSNLVHDDDSNDDPEAGNGSKGMASSAEQSQSSEMDVASVAISNWRKFKRPLRKKEL